MALIAINQQLGSRGFEIGRLLAMRLGYRMITGQEMVEITSRRYNVTPDQLLVVDLRAPYFWERFTTDTERLVAFIRAVTLKEMAHDRLVLVGRSPAQHLPDVGCGLKVRVVGSFAERVAAVAHEQKLTPAAAERRVRDYDRELRSRVQKLYGIDIEDQTAYDLVLNGSRLPLEVAVATLEGAARQLAACDSEEQLQKLRDEAVAAEVRAALYTHPQMVSAQFRVRCDRGTVKVSGRGLVPPWDGIAESVAKQCDGVDRVQVVAEETLIRLIPE